MKKKEQKKEEQRKERQREKELFLLRAGGDLPGGEFLRGADFPGDREQAEPWPGGSQFRQ
mgnify:CR=1 FL=1